MIEFHSAGQHYWYDISQNMNCDDFYPVFIMYNGKRLNSFGWNTYGDLKSKRYEHPSASVLKVSEELIEKFTGSDVVITITGNDIIINISGNDIIINIIRN